MLLFEVSDHGIGLSDEAMSNLFKPFKQAQRLAGGTGLGLYSLAKRIDAIGGFYGAFVASRCLDCTVTDCILDCAGIDKRTDGEQGSIFWFTVPYRPDSDASLHAMLLPLPLSSTTLSPLASYKEEKIHVDPRIKQQQIAQQQHQHDSRQEDMMHRPPLDPRFKHLMEQYTASQDHQNNTNNNNNNNISSNLSCMSASEISLSSSVSTHSAPKTAHQTAVHSSRPDGKRAYHILVVDDSPTILKMTSMMLKKQGGLCYCIVWWICAYHTFCLII
jgi:hypothetical protein